MKTNRSEIEKLLHSSLYPGADPEKVREEMQSLFPDYDFNSDFKDRIFKALFSGVLIVKRYEFEFLKSISWAFSRVAIISVAAIVLLLISIFITEDSFSLNAVLGLSETDDETILSMLTGY